MNLGELLCLATKQEPPKGNITGICVMCGQETNAGIPLKNCVSDNFMGWNSLFAGNCMCPHCAFLFSDQVFRRKSWVASPEEFRTFKNVEASEILFNPPNPPFFIYIAKIGQRQSWLCCIDRVAGNRNRYFLSHEHYDVPILFERDKAEGMLSKILESLSLGISKTELRSCVFKMKTWEKAYKEGFTDLLRELEGYKQNLLWEVMVDVANRGGQAD